MSHDDLHSGLLTHRKAHNSCKRLIAASASVAAELDVLQYLSYAEVTLVKLDHKVP